MSDVESLLRERHGYVVRGLKDRVAQVDVAIKALGGVVVADDEPEVETASTEPTENARRGPGRPRKS